MTSHFLCNSIKEFLSENETTVEMSYWPLKLTEKKFFLNTHEHLSVQLARVRTSQFKYTFGGLRRGGVCWEWIQGNWEYSWKMKCSLDFWFSRWRHMTTSPWCAQVRTLSCWCWKDLKFNLLFFSIPTDYFRLLHKATRKNQVRHTSALDNYSVFTTSVLFNCCQRK